MAPFTITPLIMSRPNTVRSAHGAKQPVYQAMTPSGNTVYLLSEVWPILTDTLCRVAEIWAAWEQEQLRGLLVFSLQADHATIKHLVVDSSVSLCEWGERLLCRLLWVMSHVTVDIDRHDDILMALYHQAGFLLAPPAREDEEQTKWRLYYRRRDGYLDAPVLSLDGEGWVNEAIQIMSPNYDVRPEGMQAELIVIHAISLPPYHYGGNGVQQLFMNSLDSTAHPYYATIHTLRVSAHFFIRRNGALCQFVSVAQRAWHAGLSCWQGRTQCNDFSIGIELEGGEDEPFCDAQYRQLIALIRLLKKHCPLSGIAGHQHIAPRRKTDPGPWFDWERVQRAIDMTLC